MYFLKHPITFIDYLIARIFISDISFYVSLALFLLISLTYKNDFFLKLDENVSRWTEANRKEDIEKLLDKSTILGNAIFHIILCLCMATYCYLNDEKSAAYTFLFVVIFSWGLNRFLKLVFRRERPVNIAGEVKKRISFSYPSGHAMASISIYFFTAMILKNDVHFLPWYLISFLISLIILATRVYLNHHFFTDVIGGIFMGIVCLRLTVWSYFFLG